MKVEFKRLSLQAKRYHRNDRVVKQRSCRCFSGIVCKNRGYTGGARLMCATFSRIAGPVQQRPSGAGALIGAIAGAAIGNHIGSGAGRAVATGIGLVAGAAVGADLVPPRRHFSQLQSSRTAPHRRWT